MALNRKTRMYEPWGYQEENDYASSKTLFEIELEKLFAGSKYNKDDKKIHFYNLEGKDLGSSIDTTEFSSGVIEDASYDPTTKILTITFSNGDKVEINLADLIDETEFGDGLQVNGGIVSIKLANGDGTEKYLSVDENGISASLLDAVVDEIKESIQAEIDRATAAEADLQAAIDQEVADREADVDAEQTRAEAAEQALQAAIDQEVADRELDVDAEETRAKAAEQTLTTNLANEVTRSTNKDNDHDAQLNIADQRLDLLEAQLPAEVSRAKAAEQALQAAIDAEASRAASAETDLQAAITAEVQRAQDAETALDNKIDDAVSALTSAVEAERTRVTEAETDLQAVIDQEIADRKADVDEEETRAKGVENDLQNQINGLGSNKFDDVDYDSSAKTINFYAEGSLVKALDATPFIKDGMIDRVYIDTDTQELVIVWNSASGKEETRIPLSDIFNPANYYTKDEIDDKVDEINSAITAVEGDITTIQGDIVDINSAITEIQGDVTTIEGDITNINSAITNVQGDITNINSSITEINSSITEINEAIDEMEDQYGDEISALTNSVRELEETVENDEFTVAMALNDLNTRKLDASAYTPTDLSNYYTKDETSGKTEIADALDNFYTKEEIDAADYVVSESLNNLNTRINAHTADTDVHVTTAEKTAWNAKADLSDIPSVTPYADSVKYNSTTHFVEFYHGTTAGTKVFEYDASPFLVDGMVESVEVVTVDDVKYLRITWNSAAGGQVTDIPLGDLFDPSLYYTKDEIDAAEYTISKALVDLDERKLDASAYTPTDLSNYYTKSETYSKDEVDARDLWVSGTGRNSVTMKGTNNTANGIDACAEGGGNKANGDYSHAEGYATVATGLAAHTEGYYSSGTSDASHAEGNRTKATGQFSHAEGAGTTASGQYSHAEGAGTTASGNYSHAEGASTTASGHQSHAEGAGTTASGQYSHAEGNSTSATTEFAHAEGTKTLASSYGSHAEGSGTTANGLYSHTEGLGTIANNQSEHASGQYNVSISASTTFGDSGNTLFSVGNGTYDNTRHNAFEIRQNGDIYITINGNDVLLQDYITELERITAKALVDLDARLKALEG